MYVISLGHSFGGYTSGGVRRNMAATTAATCGCKTTTFFHLSLPTPPTHKFSSFHKQLVCSTTCSNFSLSVGQPRNSWPSYPRSVSSPETPAVEEEEEESGSPPSDDDLSLGSATLPSLTGCQACGREEIEKGCNGEGRIQGGIATVPGFGWWPIKAYRPCPAFVASGGRYRRSGQSMDEVVSGSGGKNRSKRTSNGA